MTDNEKRAHDLAVAMAAGMMKPEVLQGIAIATGQDEIHFDLYGVYKDYYKILLPLFNQDFPSGA